MKIIVRILFVASACLFLQLNANAIIAEGNLNITKINAKLKEITSAKIEFRQTFEGKMEKGVVYYKKNQGLFMKYYTMPVSVLVNSGVTTYYDSKLEQKSEIPTQKSAARIFTYPLEINSNTLDIESIEELPEAILVRASINSLKGEGIFSMYFSRKDYLLRRIDIESENGGKKNRIDLHSYSFTNISNERFKSINVEKYI